MADEEDMNFLSQEEEMLPGKLKALLTLTNQSPEASKEHRKCLEALLRVIIAR